MKEIRVTMEWIVDRVSPQGKLRVSNTYDVPGGADDHISVEFECHGETIQVRVDDSEVDGIRRAFDDLWYFYDRAHSETH